MSAQMTDAMKTAKQIQAEMVQWEGRVDFLKSEFERLTKTKDALQAQIDEKTANFNIYIAQRDSETKRSNEEMLTQRAQLEKEKSEFIAIMNGHKAEKDILEDQKKLLESEKARAAAALGNVKVFVGAVQRAITVLGL